MQKASDVRRSTFSWDIKIAPQTEFNYNMIQNVSSLMSPIPWSVFGWLPRFAAAPDNGGFVCECVEMVTCCLIFILDLNLQEEFYGRKLILADREEVEQEADNILKDADVGDVAFLVVGDPFG